MLEEQYEQGSQVSLPPEPVDIAKTGIDRKAEPLPSQSTVTVFVPTTSEEHCNRTGSNPDHIIIPLSGNS